MPDHSNLPIVDPRELSPGDIVWSNSMLKSMRSCEQSFTYRYIDGLDTRGSHAMERGSWFHFVLACQGWAKGHREDTLLVRPDRVDPRLPGIEGLRIEWEPTGLDGPVFTLLGRNIPAGEKGEGGLFTYPLNVSGALAFLTEQVWEYLPSDFREAEEEAGTDLPSEVANLVTRYLFNYREDLKAEKVLMVEAGWTREHNGVTYKGTVDRVVETPDGLVTCRDHKTHQNLPSSVFRLTDSQLHFYAWGLLPLLEEHGVEVNAIEFDYSVTRKPAGVRITKAGAFYKNMGQLDLYSLIEGIKAAGYAVDHPPFQKKIEEVKKEDNPFFLRKLVPLNTAVIGRILYEAHTLTGETFSRLQRGGAVRNVDWMNCDRCAYKELCTGDTYGNDTTLLLNEFDKTTIVTTSGEQKIK